MDRALQISQRLLQLEASIKPAVDEIEVLSEELRGLVAAAGNNKVSRDVAGWGSVTASAASIKELKGTKDVLDLQAWLALAAPQQTKLRKSGLVVTEQLWSQARKSSVSIKLKLVQLANVA
jgi:hypothetical protein